MLYLGFASLVIALLSFATVSRIATRGPRAPDPAPAPLAGRIGWALKACGNRVPWKAVCFQRALAAQLMLRRRGFAAMLGYGIRRDEAGALAAHVWTRSGDVDVVGCENAADFHLLTSLEPGVPLA